MVEEGLRLLLQVVPPVPVTLLPSLRCRVHAPLAVIVPLTGELVPLHTVALMPVTLAVGL